MRFLVSRASDWERKDKPCERAVLLYSEGDGEYDRKFYTVEIDSLYDLEMLIAEVNHPVIVNPHKSEATRRQVAAVAWPDENRIERETMRELVIYDDYLE